MVNGKVGLARGMIQDARAQRAFRKMGSDDAHMSA